MKTGCITRKLGLLNKISLSYILNILYENNIDLKKIYPHFQPILSIVDDINYDRSFVKNDYELREKFDVYKFNNELDIEEYFLNYFKDNIDLIAKKIIKFINENPNCDLVFHKLPGVIPYTYSVDYDCETGITSRVICGSTLSDQNSHVLIFDMHLFFVKNYRLIYQDESREIWSWSEEINQDITI